MNTTPISLAWLCAAVMALSACSDKVETPTAEQTAAAHASAPAGAEKPPEPEGDDAALNTLGNKLSGYIKCYNALDGRAHKSISRYSSWVKDMNVGPTGKERVVYGTYSLSNEDIAKCQQAYAALEKEGPALSGLDAAGRNYMQTLTNLGTVVSKVYTYYDRENYKDDSFAQGRTLHTEFKPAIEAFSQASNRFSDELDSANNALQLERLKLIEKAQGKSLTYWTTLQSIRAKQMVDILLKDDFSVDAASQAFTDFEAAVDGRNAQLSKQGAGTQDITAQIPSTAEALRKSAKALIRRVRDKTPYHVGEITMLNNANSGWMVEGSPPRVLYDYNNFVEASNRYQ